MKAYNKQGKPLRTIDEFMQLFMDDSYKRVALTKLKDYSVSTVWLGFDRSFGGGKPLIFETMVFLNDTSIAVDNAYRYATLKDAKAGHRKMVEKYKQSKPL